MAGGGFVLGGALEGIGKGISTVAEESGKEMRERARLEMIDRMNDENAKVEREFKTTERIGVQDFTKGEREAGQGYSTDERIDTQKFQSGENAAARGFTANENRLTREQQVYVLGIQNEYEKEMAKGNHERAREILGDAFKNNVALNAQESNLRNVSKNFDSDRERIDAQKERDRVATEASAAKDKATGVVAGKSYLPAFISDKFTDFTRQEVATEYANQLIAARDAGLPEPVFNEDNIKNDLRARRDTTAGGAVSARANLTGETGRLESVQQQLRDARNPPSPPAPPAKAKSKTGRTNAAIRDALDSGEYTDAKEVDGRIQVQKGGKWYWYEE